MVLIRLVPGFKHVSRACPTRVRQARPWKTNDVLLIFVFLDDASTVRSCNVISEHHVLAWIIKLPGYETAIDLLVIVSQ